MGKEGKRPGGVPRGAARSWGEEGGSTIILVVLGEKVLSGPPPKRGGNEVNRGGRESGTPAGVGGHAARGNLLPCFGRCLRA